MITLVDVYTGTGIRDHALEFLYLLLQQREPAHNISHRALPTFEQHRQFVTRRPYAHWYLIEADRSIPPWVGMIYLTQQNEIGVFITKTAHGLGIGPAAVQALMAAHPTQPLSHAADTYRPWLANIAPANERSKRMFERLGFRKISETYAYFQEEHDGKETPR